MRRIASLLIALSCTACTSIGPQTLPQDHFDYNAAIAQSAQDQPTITYAPISGQDFS